MAPQVLVVPKWVIILRGIQLLLAVIVLGISAYGVYWIAFNSWGFAIFTSLVTVVIVFYGVLTAKITALHKGYNQWAVVALDALMVIFWLSAMAAIAATRTAFRFDTNISSCSHSGTIGGGFCARDLSKRDAYFATYGYLNLMSGAAGISAIEMILFIVTLILSSIALHRLRKSGGADIPTTNESKLEAHPMDTVQQQQQQQFPAQYQQPQHVAPAQQQKQYQQPPVQYQQQAYPQASQ